MQIKRIAFLLVFCLLILVCPLNIQAQSLDVVTQADEAFIAENYGEALSLYDRLGESSHNQTGRLLCEVKLGHYYRALECAKEQPVYEKKIRQVISLYPNRDVMQYYRGLVEGLDSFGRIKIIVSQNPDYPDQAYYQGLFYAELFSDDLLEKSKESVRLEVLSYFENLKKDYPEEELFSNEYQNILLLCMRESLVTKSIDEAGEILEKIQNDDENRNGNSYLLYRQGQYKQAASLIEESENNQDSVFSIDLLIRCYFRMQNYQKASEYADRLEKLLKQEFTEEDWKNEELYLTAFQGAIAKKLHQKIIFKEALQSVESSDAELYTKACAYALLGKNRKALEEITIAVNADSSLLNRAKWDPDLNGLHIFPKFQKLVDYSYMEEFDAYYTAAILVFGLGIYFFLWYHDRKKSSKLLLVFLSIIFVSGTTTSTYAYDSQLLQESKVCGNDLLELTETEQYQIQSCMEQETQEFKEEILDSMRTITPLQSSQIDQVAELVKPAAVNMQAYSNGMLYGQGSGVIVSYTDDELMIVGCRHTLYTDDMRVRFTDGVVVGAKIVGKSEHYDVSVLCVETDKIPEETREMIKKVNIDYSANLQLAIGNPLLSNGYITTKGYIHYEGSVTNLRKSFSNFIPDYTNHVPYLLTSTGAEAGTSGGGTFDGYGNFLGIQAGIVISSGERYVVPLDILAEEYEKITGGKLE